MLTFLKRALTLLLSVMTVGTAPVTDTEGIRLSYFCYSHSGTMTDYIYSYCLIEEEEGMVAEFEFYAGYLVYRLPAEDEDIAALCDVIERYDLYGWDGFSESDPYILDGEGFGLTIIWADGNEVNAHGSNCTPHGYYEAVPEIEEIFGRILTRNGIDPEADWYDY